MNSKQRLESVLQGKKPDRVPVILHNFLMVTRESDVTNGAKLKELKQVLNLELPDLSNDPLVNIWVEACYGNIDPTAVLAHGSRKDVKQKVIKLLKLYSDSHRFILNSGCAIPASTPPENILEMIKCVKGFVN